MDLLQVCARCKAERPEEPVPAAPAPKLAAVVQEAAKAVQEEPSVVIANPQGDALPGAVLGSPTETVTATPVTATWQVKKEAPAVPTDKWKCTLCTQLNPDQITKCSSCGRPKGHKPQPVSR